MNTLYLPLAVDSNYQPLSVSKQLAIALAKAVPKSSKIKKATLIGWPLLLVKYRKSEGYVVFDETLSIETKLQFTVLQDYEKIVKQLESTKNESEILAILKSYRWKEVRGKEEEIFKGAIPDDISPLFSYTYSGKPLPLKILDKNITDFDIENIINNISSRESIILENINKINEIEEKINTIITILKGKKAEERKQIEDKYDSMIKEKTEELKNQVAISKKGLEDELRNEANKLYSKMPEIEVMVGEKELDFEADNMLQKELENALSIKSKYLNEIQEKLNEIKNKYKAEIRNIKNQLEELKLQKQRELNAIDARIKELNDLQKIIIDQLEELKQTCNNELEKLRLFIKKAPFDADKVEVILPFLLVVDTRNNVRVIQPQIYNDKRRSSFFGLFKKDVSEISNDINVNLSAFSNIIMQKSAELKDNLKSPQLSSLIEQGLNELYEDGWGVRKSLNEYYG